MCVRRRFRLALCRFCFYVDLIELPCSWFRGQGVGLWLVCTAIIGLRRWGSEVALWTGDLAQDLASYLPDRDDGGNTSKQGGGEEGKG